MKRTLPILFWLTLIFAVGADRQRPTLAQETRASPDGIGYKKFRVKGTRILFPRLTRYSNQRVIQKVNRQIAKTTSEFGCNGSKGYFKVRSKVAYAARDIFSIYAAASYDCNCAYPTDNSNVSLTFDLRTGRQINFEDLFRNYGSNRERIREVIAQQRNRTARLALLRKGQVRNCPEPWSSEQLAGIDFSFSFSAGGLQVQPDLPHSIAACTELVIVPYSRLLKFAAPHGLIARVAGE